MVPKFITKGKQSHFLQLELPDLQTRGAGGGQKKRVESDFYRKHSDLRASHLCLRKPRPASLHLCHQSLSAPGNTVFRSERGSIASPLLWQTLARQHPSAHSNKLAPTFQLTPSTEPSETPLVSVPPLHKMRQPGLFELEGFPKLPGRPCLLPPRPHGPPTTAAMLLLKKSMCGEV